MCYFLSILQLTLFAAGVALITIMSHGLSLATKLWLAKQETQRLAKQQQEAAEQRRQVSEAWQVGTPKGHSSLGAALSGNHSSCKPRQPLMCSHGQGMQSNC